MQKKFDRGFTLIELVATLAILAILVSAAIAAFQNISQKAQISQLRATLKNVRSAILIQKARNELNAFMDDGTCGPHPRFNFWPTFEEVRKGSYEDQLSGSILDVALSGNPFIDNPRTPPFDNTFMADCSTSIFYNNPDASGKSNIANNLVVCAPQNTIKGTLCPASPCSAGWVYNPYTGEFWANSNRFGENSW